MAEVYESAGGATDAEIVVLLVVVVDPLVVVVVELLVTEIVPVTAASFAGAPAVGDVVDVVGDVVGVVGAGSGASE